MKKEDEKAIRDSPLNITDAYLAWQYGVPVEKVKELRASKKAKP
jgi:hypothetical protein